MSTKQIMAYSVEVRKFVMSTRYHIHNKSENSLQNVFQLLVMVGKYCVYHTNPMQGYNKCLLRLFKQTEIVYVYQNYSNLEK